MYTDINQPIRHTAAHHHYLPAHPSDLCEVLQSLSPYHPGCPQCPLGPFQVVTISIHITSKCHLCHPLKFCKFFTPMHTFGKIQWSAFPNWIFHQLQWFHQLCRNTAPVGCHGLLSWWENPFTWNTGGLDGYDVHCKKKYPRISLLMFLWFMLTLKSAIKTHNYLPKFQNTCSWIRITEILVYLHLQRNALLY